MPIFQTAQYQVAEGAVADVEEAIREFVAYVRDHEPGSRLYASWQQEDDPTKFVHLFIFDDLAAQAAHGESQAVRDFEAVYQPQLVAGPVVFTNYVEVATNQP